MNITAISAILLTVEVYSQAPRMSLIGPDASCFDRVLIENTAGNYNATETLQTAHGPVSIRYETVGGHNPEDHDKIDVVDLPDGVVAIPPFMDIPDGHTGTVCLVVYRGG